MLRPPTGTLRSGLRAVKVNVSGAFATSSMSSARSMRTRYPSTSARASFQYAIASSSRKSMPTSSRIHIEASWMRSTPSSSSTS